MILVDTSVWISHFKKADRKLIGLLEADKVGTHPFVIGEIALGGLKNRDEILRLLGLLPQIVQAGQSEVLHLVERNVLFGKGVGWVDAHLLASAKISKCPIWTFDKSLARVAENLGSRWGENPARK